MPVKKFVQDFKEFAVKGNMIDIAIGVIIGGAFNKVVDILVKQILMPPLSMLTGGIQWGSKKIILQHAVESPDGNLEEISINYGMLIVALTDFLIIGLTIFVVVKFIQRLKEKAENPADGTMKTPKDIELLSEMKELMLRQNEIMKSKK